MQTGRKHDEQEPDIAMHAAESTTTQPALDSLLDAPVVRPDAVARARQLLASPRWCRAEEVASRLVDCLVDNRLP